MSSSLLLRLLGLETRVYSELTVVITDLSDETLGKEISDDFSGNGAIDLELVDKFRDCDSQDLWNLLLDSLV